MMKIDWLPAGILLREAGVVLFLTILDLAHNLKILPVNTIVDELRSQISQIMLTNQARKVLTKYILSTLFRTTRRGLENVLHRKSVLSRVEVQQSSFKGTVQGDGSGRK
jgi:hypothetical protein